MPAIRRSGGAPPVAAAGTVVSSDKKNRVVLEKGHSQVDWMRLTRTAPDLAGLRGERPGLLTVEDVRRHSSADDCWTVLEGRVYNITPYLSFHPGGVDMLLQGAGRDSTALFLKYHPWVNMHFMLAKCMVGRLEDGQPGATEGGGASRDEDDEDEDSGDDAVR